MNSEQQQLADAIARWAEKDYGFEKRKHIISSDEGVSTTAWQALAELGQPLVVRRGAVVEVLEHIAHQHFTAAVLVDQVLSSSPTQ